MKHLYVNKREMLLSVIILLYRLVLDWCYIYVIAPNYGYYGFSDLHNGTSLLWSWVILICYSFITIEIQKRGEDRNSTLIIWVIFLLSFVPFTSCVFTRLISNQAILYNCLYWMVLLLLQVQYLKKTVYRFPSLKASDTIIDDWFVLVVGIFSLLLVVIISGYYAHFRLSFDLLNVYDIRQEARNYHFPTIVSYLFSWTKSINPILLAYCLIKQKRGQALLYFVTQMLCFGIDGSKLVFFMPFVVVFVVWGYNRISPGGLRIVLATGMLGGGVIGVFEYLLFHSYNVITLFIRRVLFLPNYLFECYFDYFHNRVPDFFRSSFLRLFGFSSPYSGNGKEISFIIGNVYFGNPNADCNNGLASEAIANLGWIGFIIMPIVLIIILSLFDRSTSDLDKRLSAVSSIYIAFLLISTFSTRVLLTHGLIVLMVLLALINPESLKTNSNEKVLSQ